MTEDNNDIRKEDDLKLIELYIEKKLIARENEYIEDRLRSDIEFRKMFENYIQASEILKLIGRLQLKRQLEQVHQEEIKSGNNYRFLKVKLISLAAVLTGLLITVVPLYYIFFYHSNNQDIFNEYYSPYPDIITEKGITSSSDISLNTAIYFYNNKKYKVADSLFNIIRVKNDTVLFYYGVSLLAEGKANQSVKVFKELLSNKSIFNIYGKTEWYLALAYLKNNDKTNASIILNKIIASKNEDSPKASEILKKLNQ